MEKQGRAREDANAVNFGGSPAFAGPAPGCWLLAGHRNGLVSLLLEGSTGNGQVGACLHVMESETLPAA